MHSEFMMKVDIHLNEFLLFSFYNLLMRITLIVNSDTLSSNIKFCHKTLLDYNSYVESFNNEYRIDSSSIKMYFCNN